MAVDFGLDILVRGMRLRVQRGKTGRLAGSIRKTKVKNDHARHRIVGRAIVTARYAMHVEYGTRHNRAFPFVRPTKAVDGPVAVRAMAELMRV